MTQSSAPTSSSSSRRAPPFSGIRAWLLVADALLRAIESTVWELRNSAAELASQVASGTDSAREEARRLAHRLARLTSTGKTLAAVATSYRLHVTKAAFLPKRTAKASLEKLHAVNARRLREAAETHGGAFLKVGQLLSSRPDVLPSAYVEELSVLQDAAPRVPFEAVREVVEHALRAPIPERFAFFDEEPIAAASIGQVHRARTLDGRDVAVKVQRPGIELLVEQDLALLEIFLEAIAPMFPPTDHATIAREIRASILRELDLRDEAEHTKAAAAFFADADGVFVPEVVDALSTERVLTTRFVVGRKITLELDALALAVAEGDEEAAARRDRILGRLLEAFLRQALEAGRFQADPHPGNVLVTPDGEVVLLDFGCTEVMTKEARRGYLALVQAFVARDEEGMARELGELGFRTRSGRPDTLLRFADVLLGAFARSEGLASFPSPEQIAAEARALLAAASDDPVVTLPGEFIMLARVFGALAGLFVHYRPSIDVGSYVLPVLVRAMATP